MMKLFIIIILSLVIGCEANQEQEAESRELSKDVEGCWVNLYGQKRYAGKKITFKNSLDLPSLVFKNEKNWAGSVQSLWVGPKAEVSVYHGPDFKDFALQISPKGGIDGVSGISFSQIGSLKIHCIK